MKWRFSIIGVLIVAMRIGSNSAQELVDSPTVSAGYFKAQDFLRWSKEAQAFYAMGIADGFRLAPFLGAPEAVTAQWVEKCLNYRNGFQLAAIIEKDIKDHPQWWHRPLNITAWEALKTGCGYTIDPKAGRVKVYPGQ